MKSNKLLIRILFLFYCSTLAPSCSHIHQKNQFTREMKYRKQAINTPKFLSRLPLNTNSIQTKPKKLVNEFTGITLLKK